MTIPVDPAAYEDPREWVQVAALMADDGFSAGEIARTLDRSYDVVYNAVTRRKHNGHVRRPENSTCTRCGQPMTHRSTTALPICRPCRKEVGRINDERIIELWQQGFDRVKIAADLGLDPQYVSGRVVNIRLHQGIDLERRRR